MTGGVAAVKELVQFFKAGVSRASRGIRSIGKRSLDSMKAFSTFFDDLFRQVTKDPKALFERFKQWLDELIQAIKKELGLVDEIKKIYHKGGDFTKSFFENAGIAIKRINVIGKVYGQTKDYTCVANSLRMALSDRNIMKTEEYLATALKTDKKGARILDIPEALHHSYIDDVAT